MTIEDRLARAFRGVRDEEAASPSAWAAIQDGLGRRKRKSHLLARIGLATAPLVALGGIGFGTAEVLTPASSPVHVNVGLPSGTSTTSVTSPPTGQVVSGTTTVASTAVPTTTGSGTVPTTTGTSTAPVQSAPSAPTTSAPSTTASTSPAGSQACTTNHLDVSLGASNGTAGTVYYDLDFENTGPSACTLYGYPGVSYVTGTAGTQVGAAASRAATLSGGAGQTVVPVAPGATATAVVGEVDVQNYPAATCQPAPVLGLRVYPPGEQAAAFVRQQATGCAATNVSQLQVGYIVPPQANPPAPSTTVAPPPPTTPSTTAPANVITGTVVDSSGQPVAGAYVIGLDSLTVARTNASGQFTMSCEMTSNGVTETRSEPLVAASWLIPVQLGNSPGGITYGTGTTNYGAPPTTAGLGYAFSGGAADAASAAVVTCSSPPQRFVLGAGGGVDISFVTSSGAPVTTDPQGIPIDNLYLPGLGQSAALETAPLTGGRQIVQQLAGGTLYIDGTSSTLSCTGPGVVADPSRAGADVTVTPGETTQVVCTIPSSSNAAS